MLNLAALAAGYVLDLLFGDPAFLYHPIRIIGNLIALIEKLIRPHFSKSDKSLLTGGVIQWILTVAISFAVPCALLVLGSRIHPAIGFALETFWTWQILATRSLRSESMKVYRELKKGDLEGGRYAVSMIVGRDTQVLDEIGVTKAAVETVAENTSDGVIAPLVFLALGGASVGFLYKAVNTMDSMLGYKNDKYLYYGRCAAKMDDVFNYLPARLSGWLMIFAAYLLGMDGKNAKKIYLRDRYNHASPNSAQTEAVMAGALDVQLAGDASYFGKIHKKPFIGDPIRPVEIEDIPRANRLMYMTSFLGLLVALVIRAGILYLKMVL